VDTAEPDVAERLARLLAADPFARRLGIAFVDVAADGAVTVALELGAEHENFHGVTHGGALFTLADTAFALASNAAGPRAVAIDTHLVLTGATRAGDTLRATAREVTRGRTLATYRVTVTRGDGRICGVFTGTVFIGER